MSVKKQASPLVKRFESYGMEFVFDAHTNRIFRLAAAEASAFDVWAAGARLSDVARRYPSEAAMIRRSVARGLFSRRRPDGLSFGGGLRAVASDVRSRRTLTILEITQRCNLRCGYCTFGGGFSDHRKLNGRMMSSAVLMAAIDDAVRCATGLEELSIGFYGGEPLAAFPLIISAVRYARQQAGDKKIRFSLTTNATLLDRTKAEFLRDNEFSVLVSVDGPRVMHDRYRIYPGGRGSFGDTMRGLKVLLAAYGEPLRGKIGLNMVLPSRQWGDHVWKLWRETPWLPKDLRARAGLVDAPDGMPPPPPSPPVAYGKTIKGAWVQSVENNSSEYHPLSSEIYDMRLSKIHQREIHRGPRDSFYPNGCCVPGARRVYVRADGTYQVCERAHGTPTIGSVRTGVDIGRVLNLVREYAERSISDCKDCWAVPLCSLCFHQGYKCARFNITRKRALCEGERDGLLRQLRLYAWVLEKHPERVALWEKILIT
ncbi:MAG: radical SAM protein [Thermodesulfobacteriota bacterium]